MRSLIPLARPLMRLAGVAAVASLCVAASSCDLLGPASRRELVEFERAVRRWESQQLSSYSYVQQRLCYCASAFTTPVRVTVIDGKIVRREYVRDPQDVLPVMPDVWGTIDDLFAIILDAIESGAVSVLVEYDPILGYPTHMAIDYSHNIADDEIVITASDLAVASAALRR